VGLWGQAGEESNGGVLILPKLEAWDSRCVKHLKIKGVFQ